jgi:hypothetical protein
LNLIRVMPAKGQGLAASSAPSLAEPRIDQRERDMRENMQASIFLARLLGPLLFVVGVGILLNPRAFRTMAVEVVGSLTLVYLFGLIDFAAGLAIVLTHNVWLASWRVLITLIGWLLLIRGALRILLPDTVMGYAVKFVRNKRIYPIAGIVLIILGVTLCYFGYVA